MSKAIFAAVLFLIIVIGMATLQKPATTTSTADPERGRKFQLAVAGALMLRDRMRNPESFVVESALVIDGSETLCYQYRAQNGFGGMGREIAVIAVKSNKVAYGSNNQVRTLWNKECANKPNESIETVNSALRYAGK